jgi:glycosyltransferase involved in cell wall biosynthesis
VNYELTISVIIPVYKAVEFVEDCVTSCLIQSEVSEIILVYDGSRDGSYEKCLELKELDKKITVLTHQNKCNRGAGESRNLGIKHATSPLIAFLDADDYFLPNRFKKTIEVFKNEKDCDGVYESVGADFDNLENKEKFLKVHSNTTTTVTKALPPESLLEQLVYGSYGRFCTGGLTIKKSLIEKVGLFNTRLELAQDIHFYLKCAAIGKLYAGEINTPVAIRRVHGLNRSIYNIAKSSKYLIEYSKDLFIWGMDTNSISFNQINVLFHNFYYTYRSKSDRPIKSPIIFLLFFLFTNGIKRKHIKRFYLRKIYHLIRNK